ncbi:hypothetical protein QTI66_32775 [Variovorax sp. J22R133]|uniref:hypothetical protein n=1 Tax=Variovorax brevis TaxID=3053503 RepID=UPI0025772783|nr:hypothetical protein [Variovorax sp. J22R133]MDM0116903.1 hypothetical protein [Variovorax sp. J22R133]
MTDPRSFSVSHFDLFEYIRTLPQPEVAGQMAQGLAWKLDTLMQQASRSLFKYVREHALEARAGIDSLSELDIALREAEFAEHCFKAAGTARQTDIDLIGECWYFREAAHNMAAELVALCTDFRGRPMIYEIPDIDAVFYAEVKMKLKPEVRERMVKNTERRAEAFGLDEEDKARAIQRKVRVKELRLKDIGLTLEGQSGAVYEMFKNARQMSARAPGDELKFWNMSIDTQRALIEHAMTSADRAEEFSEDNTNLTDREADDISMTAMKVNKELKTVLKSPRFVVAQQQADAGTSA